MNLQESPRMKHRKNCETAYLKSGGYFIWKVSRNRENHKSLLMGKRNQKGAPDDILDV